MSGSEQNTHKGWRSHKIIAKVIYIAGACDAFINGVSPGLTIRNSLIFTLDHTFCRINRKG